MKHTSEARALTDLILQVFQLNGQLLIAGDKLTKPLGLTSARWQVLGALGLTDHPMTVSQISRTMGVSRQGVQRIVNELKAAGFVTLRTNPNHARAKLIVPTPKGKSALDRIAPIQIAWSNSLANGLNLEDLDKAMGLLSELNSRCLSKNFNADETKQTLKK